MENQADLDERVITHIQFLEGQENTGGRSGLYMRTLVATASHLNDWMAYRAPSLPEMRLAGWIFFLYMDACLNRLKDTPDVLANGETWWNLYYSLANSMNVLRTWAGNASLAVAFAEIMLVSSFILTRLATGSRVEESLGVEASVAAAAQKVPFPIDLTSSLVEQAKVVVLNLEWLCKHGK